MSPPAPTTSHFAAPRRSFAGNRLWLLGAFLSHAIVLAAFSLPYLRQMDRVIPAFPFVPDEKLIVWILSWVTHALSDPSLSVFDANIYHPAPGQLTGSEHLFALQALFAPIYLWTKQPVLSTAIVACLTYPLAAALMTALLVRLGCTRLVAWLCGLVYAVSLLRVPLNFHVLQYPNLFLPLIAIGIVQARDAPGLLRAWWLFVFSLAALLTSYYIAVIAFLAMGCWVLAELIDRRPRLGFLLTTTIAPVAAVAMAAFVLRPYIARSELMSPPALPWLRLLNLIQAFSYYRQDGFVWVAPFAFLAILGLSRRRDPTWSRLALPAILVFLLGTTLTIVGLPGWLGELASHTPLRNFRGWVRLLVLTDFGLYLLAAAGLDACRRRFGLGVAALPLAAFALLAVPRLQGLAEWETFVPRPLVDRRVPYESLQFYAGLGPGAVLELPAGWQQDSEAMLGSTLHWRPLVNGFTGYPPPHYPALISAIRRLPAGSALQQIIDLTHLSWIFLRPVEDWNSPEGLARMRDGLKASGLVGQVFELGGFTLINVTARPVHEDWYAAIATGMQPGRTALGTPLQRLSIDQSIAVVRHIGAVRAGPRPDTLLFRVAVRNEGTTTWPVLGSFPLQQLTSNRPLVPFEVYLEATWTLLDEAAVPPGERLAQRIQLESDVPPREGFARTLSIFVPKRPGTYQFDLRVVQKDGIDFYEPPSRMVHQIFQVFESAEEESSGEGADALVDAEETPAAEEAFAADETPDDGAQTPRAANAESPSR